MLSYGVHTLQCQHGNGIGNEIAASEFGHDDKYPFAIKDQLSSGL